MKKSIAIRFQQIENVLQQHDKALLSNAFAEVDNISKRFLQSHKDNIVSVANTDDNKSICEDIEILTRAYKNIVNNTVMDEETDTAKELLSLIHLLIKDKKAIYGKGRLSINS